MENENMTLKLVTNYDQVVENIHQYNIDLPKYPHLQKRLSTHEAWYYSPQYRQFGPSKFVGFVSMTGQAYEKAEGSIFDGGRTENALRPFFNVVSSSNPLYSSLEGQLKELLRRYSKYPRKGYRLNLPQGRYSIQADSGGRNPLWIRDELILALDLYFRLGSLPSSEDHLEIVKLSSLLNRLPIHPRKRKSANFRNPNSVYMKLCNFLRLDPSYPGKVLDAGSKLDVEVWDQFSNRRQDLAAIADMIRSSYRKLTRPQTGTDDAKLINEDEEFPEGNIARRIHMAKERNSKAVSQKKSRILQQSGSLKCEVCGFDFYDYYGEAGSGFAECHHVKPISAMEKGHKTRLSDLAIVCANCHRILHRTRPWLTIMELREILVSRGKVHSIREKLVLQ